MRHIRHHMFCHHVGLNGLWDFTPLPGERLSDFRPESSSGPARPMAVPGSWAEQYGDLKNYFGLTRYDRVFRVPHAWREQAVFLRVGAANQSAKVYVNGYCIAEQQFGHLPFEGRCEHAIRWGQDNRITVAVEMPIDPWALPPARLRQGEGRAGFWDSEPAVAYDFFPYGGIHRPVTLYALPRTHIRNVAVATPTDDDHSFRLVATVEVEGDQADVARLVVDGRTAQSPIEVGGQATLTMAFPQARRWCPDDPHLYTGEVQLLRGDSVVDRSPVTFGLRSVRVADGQLLLNGDPIRLRGFGKHEDFPVIGKALCESLIVRDFDLMRWIGANSFRTSHYPYAEETLDLADRLGFLVVGETSLVGLEERFFERPEQLRDACAILRQMIERDANHPSVITWSVANEPNVRSERGAGFFEQLADTARRADPTRPVMYVAHGDTSNNRGMTHFDLIGVNKYFGWYEELGQLEHSAEALSRYLDQMHSACGKPILLAEYGADAVAGLHGFGDELFSEEYQAAIIETQTRVAETKPYVIGTHVWNFADFQTAQSPKRVTMNRKGVFTRDRNPKLAAHTLCRMWSEV